MAKVVRPLFSERAAGSVGGLSFRHSSGTQSVSLRHTPQRSQTARVTSIKNYYLLALRSWTELDDNTRAMFYARFISPGSARTEYVRRKCRLLHAGITWEPWIGDLPPSPEYIVSLILAGPAEVGGWYFELNYTFDPDWICRVDCQALTNLWNVPDSHRWQFFTYCDGSAPVSDIPWDYGVGRPCIFKISALSTLSGDLITQRTYREQF